MIGIGIGIPFSNRIGKAVRAKSAVIEASSPNEIVITFSGNLDETSTPATSAFATTPSRTINSVVISGDTVTLTVDSPFEYGDSVTVTYTKPGSNNLKDSDGEEIADFTRGVTNNSVVYSMLLEPTGNGTGVSTLRMEVSDDITVTMEGAARFYTNAAGTTGESATWNLTAGALRTIYLKCPSNSKMVFSDGSKIINFGNASFDGWTSAANAANLLVTFTPLPLDNLRMTGNSVITGALPAGLTYLLLNGANINWTYTGALPSGITYLHLRGANINWTYTGALPAGITYLLLNGANINWTYTGALPSGITGWLYLSGANINWTYTGALPSGITYLLLSGANINWTYTGALPSGITYLLLNGANINWTGLDAGNGNITDFNLLNYRIPKMSSADMVTFLTNLTNRTGTLPSTITINDFADYASPPPEVTAAVALLKSTKGVLTVALGA